MKRLMTLIAAVAMLAVTACCACGPKCYGKSYSRAARQEMDFVDVYFLNYDKHDPFRCSPCLGD